jgi:hypothetical protein
MLLLLLLLLSHHDQAGCLSANGITRIGLQEVPGSNFDYGIDYPDLGL